MVRSNGWVFTLSVHVWAAIFSILGAFGILSLMSDLIVFEFHIGTVVEAWQQTTRQMMDAAFGWIFRLLGIEFAWYVKDYFIMSFVAAGMLARTYVKVNGSLKDALDGFFENFWRNVLFVIFWPYPFLIGLRKIFLDDDELDRQSFLIYFETVVWGLLVMAVNYALILSGAPRV
ncbi:MAG: hypothetical protein ACFB6R_05025 [Alphaproteobacteria bacterium]